MKRLMLTVPLLSALLGLSAVHAQDMLGPPLAEPAPAAESLQAVEPQPLPAAQGEPLAQPPLDTAKPAEQPSEPLRLTLHTEVPTLIDGKVTQQVWTESLVIPAERAAIIRQRGIVTQSLGEDLNRWSRALAKAQGARFERRGQGWILQERGGLKLDEAATRRALLEAIRAPQPVAAEAKLSERTAPERTLEFFMKRGVTAHLATGNTSYYGSPENRMTNIHVGTANFQDRLVEGDTFSFNRTIGPISKQNGYVDGLVISGDRTETGLGGGICQVSTTVFRALYRAGLPIRERHNHSYQVFYYKPQGLDAAIYQPSMDLQFKNNTGAALWFQSDWDDQTGELNIHVFGKPQDFKVEVGTPKVLSTTPAPKDRLIMSSSLAKGERKQIDWAAEGAKLEVERRFLKGGKVVRTETLTSQYRPWPNTFLVGPS
ncbi:VanW family protein [Deinococcus lacus]|uniref:VanW family protein n=1 Tax=Deinococcus lacus TaxID=392561 RepID=A0ABW1YC90_9DEIO